MSLSWDAVSGTSTYTILRGTTPGGEASVAIQTGFTGTSFTDKNVVGGTRYYYQIIAVNSAGESPASAEAVATTRTSHRGASLSGADGTLLAAAIFTNETQSGWL